MEPPSSAALRQRPLGVRLRRRSLGALLTALALGALAAALRLAAIHLAPFNYDEVDVLGRARAVLAGYPTATGPLTSWGIPDPPASVYLMVPPSVLPRPALAGAVWIALLNVAAVMLTYGLTRRFLGSRVALVAGLLYAVNPWAVYFSRRTWAEIVPLFTTCALWAMLMVVCGRRQRWAVLFFVALALQVQTRILALIYAPAVLLTLALFPRRWGWRWPAVGIALAVLLCLPYLGWVGLHWQELQARLAEGNRGIALTAGTSSTPGAGQLLVWTVAGYGLLPTTSAAAPWINTLGQATTLTIWVVAAALIAGVVIALRALIRRPDGWEPIVLSAVWLLPLVALVAQSSSVYLHYMVALFPAVFVVLALPLAALLGRGLLGGLLAGAILLLIGGTQMVTTGTLYRILSAYDPDAVTSTELRQAAAGLARDAAATLGTGERYGVEAPLIFWQELADRTRSEADRAGLDEVWILAGGTDPLTEEVPARLDYLLRPRLTPRFLPPDTLIFPIGHPTLILEAPDVDPPESVERFGERRAWIPLPSTSRAGRDFARLTLAPARFPESWARWPPTPAPATFAAGVELLGFRSPDEARTGEQLSIVTYWRLRAGGRDRPVPAIRLRDEAGTVAAEAAAPREWPTESPATVFRSPGDRIIVLRQVLRVPMRANGTYHVEVSLSDARLRPEPRTGPAEQTAPLASVRVTSR